MYPTCLMESVPDPAPARQTQRLKSFFFHVFRRLLFVWIRPTILGTDHIPATADDSVVYALQTRSLTDLMVVDRGCETASLPRPYLPVSGFDESRSFFFLNRPEGTFGRRSGRQKSTRLKRLLQAVRAEECGPEDLTKPTRTLKIVPVALYWGHQPDKEQSMFRALFSENWSASNRFRKLMSILFHRTHILVQFSEPIDVGELLGTETNPAKQERKLLRVLRVHFTGQKRAILGPDLSHRRTLISNILGSNAVQAVIDAETDGGSSRDKLLKRASAHANEIVSHQSYMVVRFFDVLLTWLWHKLYDGILVANVETVKHFAESHEIVYVPCHRSHIDYLLLSYVLYHNGLTPPHIAAGRNLNLPIVGALLRRAGAFFMRRSFQGDALYRAVFDEYIHLIFIKGYSMEYFIEGGRSRTGRMLNPKSGMLSMTIRSLQRNASLPIVLMPVYIGYERIIEGTTYLSELQGKTKKDESIFDIFRVLGALKGPYGEVSVTFGTGVQLDHFLDEALPNWRDPGSVAPARFSSAALDLARLLAARINGALHINAVNLVATAILSTPRQTIEHERLLQQLDLLARIARDTRLDDHISVTTSDAQDVLSHASAITGLTSRDQDFGEIWSATPQQSVLLTWYRNSSAHAFIVPSLVARCVSRLGPLTKPRLKGYLAELAPYLAAEFYIELDDAETALSKTLQALCDNTLVDASTGSYRGPEPATAEFVALNDLARIVVPTLERFFIVTSLVQSQQFTTVSELEQSASAIARRLSAIYGINSPSFFDRSLFSTFVNRLKAHGLVRVSQGEVAPSVALTDFDDVIKSLIDPEVQYQVTRAIAQALPTAA